LKNLVGKKDFTLFSDETIENMGQILLRAIVKPTRITLRAPTLGATGETVIEFAYTFDEPIGLLYTKKDGNSASPVEIMKNGESKREIIVAIDAQPYLQKLMENKEALNIGRFLGGTILTVIVQ
jgi:hypothetical protein